MVDIINEACMHVYDRYIPVQEYTEDKFISTSEIVTVVKANYHKILFGGDQLTAARMRNAQKSRLNSDLPKNTLDGIIPVVEDWHIKANPLG